ncbi:MAG: cation transporter [Candidatus Amesbacteria bacterium]|nr:cation transporter [Candidatus Amesbacteria bacterium]
MKKIFKITGMHCASCATIIDLDLEDLKGIKSAKTSYAKSELSVEYDEKLVSEKEILESIKKSGYSVK